MVLGLRTKSRKASTARVDYLVHLKEISPWPPSESLRSAPSVLLQWENGDKNSGSSTHNVGDGKIELSKSFRLPVTLCQESSRKSTTGLSFQKNCLEFYLYELRKEKAAKGQLMGSAIINLAEYGLIKETLTISTPINFKKSSRNLLHSALYVNIQPFDKDSSSTSTNSSLSREVSVDKDGSESVRESVNEGNDKDSEIAYFTDDDGVYVSSHSSPTVSHSAFDPPGSSPSENNRNGSNSAKDGTGGTEPTLPSSGLHANSEINPAVQELRNANGSASSLSSVHLSSNLSSVNELEGRATSIDMRMKVDINSDRSNYIDSHGNQEDAAKGRHATNNAEELLTSNLLTGQWKAEEEKEQKLNGLNGQIFDAKKESQEDTLSFKSSQDATRKQVNFRSNTFASGQAITGLQGGSSEKLKHTKSVRSHFDLAKSNGLLEKSSLMKKDKEIDIPEDIPNDTSYTLREKEEITNSFSNSKAEIESKIDMLEEELREAAVVEVSLYSVVAEHGSSTNKVLAPARRLSRFYLHACKASSQAKMASAARAAISGLVLVSKSCGNDVPRLTFWLSNSIVLRAIISQAVGEMRLSAGACLISNSGGKGLEEISSQDKENSDSKQCFDDWEEPQTFLIALEKFEAWIFSRIVESVWWQTLTPHMQSSAAKGSISRKTSTKRNGLGDQEQGNFSIELWKKAFKDACERLCPIRAGGHECSCLPMLAKLVMEQLVGRLDVAMFNAILRESADEMPTDPVSDPISDSKVLPVPAGKSSFGAGVQLKNVIGNWSRWLTDLFGIDDNDGPEDTNEVGDETNVGYEGSFKAFYLLNALSDLMMLPFEMLAVRSMRKEVCPKFSASMIKRLLNNFVPDEFNPNPVPDAVFEALSEDLTEDEQDSSASFPCIATPVVYSPPSTASLMGFIGEVGSQTLQRSRSSVLRKSYTSDDELDELDSPINTILTDNSRASPHIKGLNWVPKGKGGRKVVRYQLLREVWENGEW